MDDSKEKEDRKEREKEKEPAWMGTDVPTTPSGGILGGRSADGELDAFQVWKKGQKEKERKEKEKEAEQTSELTNKPVASTSESVPGEGAAAAPTEDSMDEIQLFKLMMKREAAKKDPDQSQGSPIAPTGPISSTTGRMSPAKLKDLSIPAPGGKSCPSHSLANY